MQPRLISTTGRQDLALVHLLQLEKRPEAIIETVDSIDPRYPRSEKAVIIISTQFGCPVGCLMCDAGGHYHGNIDVEGLLNQVRFVLEKRPEDLLTKKLKVHFARMGEPALNPSVIDALKKLPEVIPTKSLMPCISTIAPRNSKRFFQSLLEVKETIYPEGYFQIQFSVNSTDELLRKRLIPMPHLDLKEIASLAAGFHRPQDRKVALNFALDKNFPVDPQVLASTFDPKHFMIKLTPINPTGKALENDFQTMLSHEKQAAADDLVQKLLSRGFDTVVSIGEPDEIEIGSNCGQLVQARLTSSLSSDQMNVRTVDAPHRGWVGA